MSCCYVTADPLQFYPAAITTDGPGTAEREGGEERRPLELFLWSTQSDGGEDFSANLFHSHSKQFAAPAAPPQTLRRSSWTPRRSWIRAFLAGLHNKLCFFLQWSSRSGYHCRENFASCSASMLHFESLFSYLGIFVFGARLCSLASEQEAFAQSWVSLRNWSWRLQALVTCLDNRWRDSSEEDGTRFRSFLSSVDVRCWRGGVQDRGEQTQQDLNSWSVLEETFRARIVNLSGTQTRRLWAPPGLEQPCDETKHPPEAP